MSNFDRNKWKAASLKANQETSKKNEEQMKSNYSSDGRPGFHSIDEGVNVFRICPPHNSEHSSFEPKVVSWIPQEIDEMKDDKPTGKKIIVNRPIFNSRIHAGTEKDIIEEYCNFVYKLISESNQDTDERKKKMAPINGWRSKDGKWNSGIRYSTSFVFYAYKGGKLARVEFYKSDKDRMEELNISESSDEPIVTDCFSDPNEGVSLIVTRQKDKDGKWENILNKREFNPKKFRSWDDFMKSEMLTDEQLMELEKAPSLYELYQNSYKRSDFEKALEGLKIFDEKNKFGVFEHDEFIDIIAEIDAYYEEEEESKSQSNSDEYQDNSNDEVDIYSMTRAELKAYILDKELDISVNPNMTDDVIKNLIKNYGKDSNEFSIPDENVQAMETSKKEQIKKNNEKLNNTPSDLPWDKKSEDESKATKNKLQAMRDRIKNGDKK